MLRATPNLNVFRPADIIETAEAWELALATRIVRACWCSPARRCRCCATCYTGRTAPNAAAMCCARRSATRDLTLIATGSEVQIAKAAAEELFAGHGVRAAVVSMPCWELFEAQNADYRAAMLGIAPRVAVEAAARLGWDRWIGRTVSSSAWLVRRQRAGGSLYTHFGITAEAVTEAARGLLAETDAGQHQERIKTDVRRRRKSNSRARNATSPA